MDSYDIIKTLGLWKWIIFFLIITIVPAINNLIRDYVRDKREAKLHDIITNLAEMPSLLEDIKLIALKRYTENISLSMCESLLQPIMENSARFLIDVLQDMIEHNSNVTDTERASGQDIIFVFKTDKFAAGIAGDGGPAGQANNNHNIGDIGFEPNHNRQD